MKIIILFLLEVADLILSFSLRSTKMREDVGTFNLKSQNLSRRVPRNYHGTRIDRNYIHAFGISDANREYIIHKQKQHPALATGGCKCRERERRNIEKERCIFRKNNNWISTFLSSMK